MQTFVFQFNVRMMNDLVQINPWLAWLGVLHLLLGVVLLLVMPFNSGEVLGINSLIKPVKFAFSIAVYAWTMALILPYIATGKQILIYSIMAILVMGFEQTVITIQAFRGELSHFNTSPVGSLLFGLMGMAIATLTIWTLVLAVRSFWVQFEPVDPMILRGIQVGIVVFAIAGFLGFYMGSQLAHTVGAPDGGPGLPFVNWSTSFGDVRVAHFFGLHALQVFPLLALLFTRFTFSGKEWVFYGAMAVYTVYVLFVALQAFMAKPFIG